MYFGILILFDLEAGVAAIQVGDNAREGCSQELQAYKQVIGSPRDVGTIIIGVDTFIIITFP